MSTEDYMDKFGDILEGNTSFIRKCVLLRTLSKLVLFLLHIYIYLPF